MKALADYMAKNKLSQAALARKLGRAESEVSRWLSGDRPPRIETMRMLSAKLDIPLAKLIT